MLQEFALTHNEVVKRRRMLSNHHDAEVRQGGRVRGCDSGRVRGCEDVTIFQWSKISSFSTTSRRSSSKLSRSKDKSKKVWSL